MERVAKYSPEDIVARLKLKPVTPYQSEIISSPLEPSVVIAGAGSGKTETMSNRVLYLVANGFVTPDQILGLTFTRKAAGELSVRIRQRLRQLAADKDFKHITSTSTSVTTYHSYAGKLLSEHAIRYGIDADAEPLGEAAIWQIASDVVRNWSDDSYRNQSAVSTVIKDLLGLSKLMLEHQVKAEDIERIGNEVLASLQNLNGSSNAEVRDVAKAMRQRNSLLPMVETFMQRRKAAGEFSFDDQMSLAADIAQNFEDVGVLERGKYKVVLLDEYQDTSQSQVRMLSCLYGGGHPVMAVGDPSQAIYTWRGASAGTMASFGTYFPKSSDQVGKAQFSLPTTFRNDEMILSVANRISGEIKLAGGQQVVELEARPQAGKGEVAYGIFETIDAEAQAITEYVQKNWSPSTGKTCAVLVRKRSQISAIEAALHEAGIAVEVIGIGGLIHVPEVADVVTMLKIITDPDAGSALMRHLTGPRINLGPRDIAALGTFSRERAKSMHADSKTFIKKIAAGNPEQLEADDQFAGSIIDALDEIQDAKKYGFSDIGYQRLVRFASDLRRLRARAGGQITDLISEIENYLTLESEITLRDGNQSGRRHLDRFLDEAAKFERTGGTVSAFLLWLDIAADAEGGLKAGAPEIRSDVAAPEDGAENPTIENPISAQWPRDPLGNRRHAFDAAIELVKSAPIHSLQESKSAEINSWIGDAQALINEQRKVKDQTIRVALPPRLSTSTLVALHKDPQELALNIRRPMPRGQDQYSRRGTAFHLWVERQFTDAATLFGDEYLDYLDPLEEDSKLEDLKKAWLGSEYANRTPVRVEVPFETTIAGILVRGRIDAVYATADGFEVVDWKTGSTKLDASAAVQLAMYRLAWAKLSGTDISKISAAFHYVPTSVTDRPADLLDESALIALITNASKESA
ncbi:MAG: ATP-dependent helicase [Actinobacteria bacterium]|nr:ATP-dependent helicase [Actinomycetota bacterium]